MSIKLYKISNSDSIAEIDRIDLENQLRLGSKDIFDLYKVYEDLAVLLTNNPDPFDLTESIELKCVCGGFVDNLEVGDWNCVGFLSNEEVIIINHWIKEKQLDSKRGFMKHYNQLSDEVKETLEDYGSEIDELYDAYFKELVKFYKSVEKNKNSVVFCSE